MVKKKQPTKKKLPNKRLAFIFVVSVALVVSFLGIYKLGQQKAKPEQKTQQSSSESTNTGTSLANPAVAEAKVIADKYFEAASNCELETANSLRLLPKNITLSKEECQKECLGGLTYKYIKPVSYSSSQSGGVTTEVAAFDYVFGCGDKAYPTLVQMVRSSEDNTWMVFNTF